VVSGRLVPARATQEKMGHQPWPWRTIIAFFLSPCRPALSPVSKKRVWEALPAMARISSQLMSTDDLPAGWESSWEGMIGSPRFEEARETCGCLIEDLRVSVTPSSKNLGQQVVQQLAERKEKRRMYELQCVLLERKRLIEGEVEKETGDTIDWAAKMKLENEGRIAMLQEAAVKAKEVERRRTCFELAKSLAIETKAQQMMEENMRREERAKEVERQRVMEVQKQQLERKGKRMEMESAKLKALQVQEEEMVRKLYSYKQMEELREEIKRRKAPPHRALSPEPEPEPEPEV